ncbi:S1 RNA-binding domain-containing protein, partial [Candidatus Uhrbacteria bacterium]|nr:S1 RNA-binding domain-containing protein [Candidatus Uhrbacteria bacterium]
MKSTVQEKKKKEEPSSALAQLLTESGFLNIPKVGDMVKGLVISVTKNAVIIDLHGYRTGVVRGPELREAPSEYVHLKPGDEV